MKRSGKITNLGGVKDQVKLGSRVRPGVLSRLVLYTAGQALVSQSINYPQRG